MKKVILFLMMVLTAVSQVNAQRVAGIHSTFEYWRFTFDQSWIFIYNEDGLISEIDGHATLHDQWGEDDRTAESKAELIYDLSNDVIRVSYYSKNLNGPESEEGSFTCLLNDRRIVREPDSELDNFVPIIYDERGRVINFSEDTSFMLNRDENGFLQGYNDESGYYSFSYCNDDVTEGAKHLVGLPTLFFYQCYPILDMQMLCNLALQYQGFFGESEPQLLSAIRYSEDGLTYEDLYSFEYEIENRLVKKIHFLGKSEDEDGEQEVISLQYDVLWESESGITQINNSRHDKMQYYDLNGRRISSPQKGLYIVKTSDGCLKKIMLR